jgi:hypothetical protein
MALHPADRAARRRQRRAVIARRIGQARARWSFRPDLDDPALGAWAKWNPFVCCSLCQSEDRRPAPWRWDGQLEPDDTPGRIDPHRLGMGRR